MPVIYIPVGVEDVYREQQQRVQAAKFMEMGWTNEGIITLTDNIGQKVKVIIMTKREG